MGSQAKRANGLRARIEVGALLLVAMLALGPTARAARGADEAEKKSPETWHSTAFVRGRMGIRVIDYWSKGTSMRARTLIAGHPITTIVRGDRYVALDELTRRGVDIRRSKAAFLEDAKRLRPFAFELDDLIRDGGEKIEVVTIGSMQAEIWRVTDGDGRRKIWMTTEQPRVPLRVEVFSRGSAETIDLDYSNWIFDLDLGPGFFETPTGFELATYEYEDYVAKSVEGEVFPIPILYPDLLHGNPPR